MSKTKIQLLSHSNELLSPITKASNVLFENGQTAQDILNDRQDAMISPVIENSSSMFKVGQGDNVDYSANVVNSAYEGMVLKGKTMVNCVQESSSQDVVLPYEFEDGQYVTINDTKESGALGVELKGQTLVNLVVGGNEQKQVGQANNTLAKYNFIYQLDHTKTYTLYFEVSGFTGVNYFNISVSGGNNGGTGTVNQDGKYKIKISPHSSNSGQMTGLWFYWETPRWADGNKAFVQNIVLLEGDYTNVDLPYFTGMASCKMPILKSVESLFDAQKIIPNNTFTYSHSTNIGRFEFTNRHDVATFTNIQLPAGTYDISFLIRGVCDHGMVAITFAKDGQVWHNCSRVDINYSQFSSTTFKEVKSQRTFDAPVTVTIVGHAWSGSAIGSGWCEFKDIRFTPVGKTSILSLPEEVVLRSLPNGVCDTFNTRTGEYVKRIGEIVLNGSEGWASHSTGTVNGTTAYRYRTNVSNMLITNQLGETPRIFCDKLPCVRDTQQEVWSTVPSILRRIASDYGAIYIVTSASTVDAFKQWLSQNPVTVQYELETPIVTKINLPSTLKSWNTTTHIYSEIPENTLYPILSHSNPTYPVILKPSTKYSIVANSYSNNHTNSTINFNLGGATASTTVGNRVTTITTPSTLSNELLTMSGRGNKLNNVMVIEGDVVGDEPYFEGICDCKSPILSNVGKNLFDANNQLSTSAKTWFPIKNNLSVNHVFSCGIELPYIEFYGANSIQDTKICYQNWDVIATFRNAKEGAVTSSKKYKYLIVAFDNNKQTLSDFLPSLQVEILEKTSYESYKSNILSVNRDKIELTEDMFEQGSLFYENNTFEQAKSFANDDTGTRSIRIRTKKLIKVKPNTTYRFSYKNSCQSWFYGYDMNENPTNSKSTVVGATEQVFTTNASTHYIALVLFKTGNPTITPSNYDYKSIQIAEVDKTIVLRSLPNGVCDTLNVETGEYVQRIGECRLDGSQTVKSWWNTTSTIGVGIPIPTMKNISKLNCDKLPVVSYGAINNDTYDKDGIASWDTGNIIRFRIEKSKLTTEDVDGVKQYLQQNPITVQYELTTPIIKTVDLSGYPFAYENGHVVLSSGSIEQSLTPKVEYSVATNRNGQIRSNQKMVERHQKQLDQLQAIILANLVNSQYNQTLTTLKYELSRV